MSRPERAVAVRWRRASGLLGVLAVLTALPIAVSAAPGPVAVPVAVSVSQSEPGYGPLVERYRALLDRRAGIEKHRSDHNALCIGIPADNYDRIAWCRTDLEAIERDKAAYSVQLREYDANQEYYQGRTAFLRKDYPTAIASFDQAMRIGGPSTHFDEDPLEASLLAKGKQAENAGDKESAARHYCDLADRASQRPSWLERELTSAFGRMRSWVLCHAKKFEVRTPAACACVRG